MFTELLSLFCRLQRYVYWPLSYSPVVDAGVRERPFLSAPIRELMSRPPLTPVPVLGGSTSHEGVLYALSELLYREKYESC